jgi:TolA-binding protein
MPSERRLPAAATAPVDTAAEADVPPPEPQRGDAIEPPPPVAREVPAARTGETTGAAKSIAPAEERKREATPKAFPGGGATSPEAELEQQAAPTTEAPGRAPAMQSAPDAESGATRSEAPPRAVAPAQGEGAAPAAAMDEESKTDTLSTEKSVGATAPSPEVRWLEEIRAFIRDGKYSDAQLSLARFVKTYPDYRVPADILQALKPAD